MTEPVDDTLARAICEAFGLDPVITRVVEAPADGKTRTFEFVYLDDQLPAIAEHLGRNYKTR